MYPTIIIYCAFFQEPRKIIFFQSEKIMRIFFANVFNYISRDFHFMRCRLPRTKLFWNQVSTSNRTILFKRSKKECFPFSLSSLPLSDSLYKNKGYYQSHVLDTRFPKLARSVLLIVVDSLFLCILWCHPCIFCHMSDTCDFLSFWKT